MLLSAHLCPRGAPSCHSTAALVSGSEQHLVNVFQRSASLFLPPLQNSCVFPPAISVAVSAARPVALLQFAGPAEVGTRSLGGPLSYDMYPPPHMTCISGRYTATPRSNNSVTFGGPNMYPPPHMTCISGRSWYAILGRASEPF